MINNKNLLSIAPMMDRTDLHYRNLLRLISKNTLLYTEMINTSNNVPPYSLKCKYALSVVYV